MKQEFENYLSSLIENDLIVKQAMNYSLLAGGKRVRPLLLLSLLQDFGCDPHEGFAVAAAIEMIHTYSLIHDDLPAMDDDDLRRGKPTCHKAYDEATAILAGDGLLTHAFETAAQAEIEAGKLIRIIYEMAKSAGCDGMIKGQCLDLFYENQNAAYDQLSEMDLRKTGELLTLPLVCGCIIAGRDEKIDLFRSIGMDLGLAFQIQDDVLDCIKSDEELGKSTSDAENNKSTYVSLLGMKKASEEADRLFSNIESKLSESREYAHTLQFIKEIARREN